MSTAKSQLQIDLTGLTEAGIGERGLGHDELAAVSERAAAAVDSIVARRTSKEVGFFDLPDDMALASEAMELARQMPEQIDTLIVLGIGGSSLGPHALYSALAAPYDAACSRSPGMPRRVFFPDNPDPVSFEALLDICPAERTMFAAITKSGGTAETSAQLLVVLDRLERTLGADRIRDHLIAITDPGRGALRGVVDDLGLRSFPVPPSVGGRFSVLSAVGVVPAAIAGLDVTGLLDGARAMRDRVAAGRSIGDNPALALAAMLQMHHLERSRPMVVLMPYLDALQDTADWFRQLWAESLGKAFGVDGSVVNVGPTPIAARGATDQHSQLQLYAEGPDDKVYLTIGVRERGTEIAIPETRVSQRAEYSYLTGRGMGELLDAELRGTVASLTRRQRPNGTIVLERLDAFALGELIMLFEAATAFAGPLYGVDPFDQPGVEEAKRLAYAALGRDGFEEQAALLAEMPEADPRYVF